MACLLACGAAPAAAQRAVVAEATLQTPSDSHEPQRARVIVRNTGSERIAPVGLACTFTGAGGAALATVPAVLAEIAGGRSAQTEVIYYGWPRAGDVACRIEPAAR